MAQARTVYRGTVFSAIADCSRPYYMQTATETTIELDGVPLVNLHGMLLPGTDWHRTEAGAKTQIVRELIRHVGQLQAVIDELHGDILHATLSTEEAMA